MNVLYLTLVAAIRIADTLRLGPAGRGQASQRRPDAEDHRRGSKSGLAGEDGT